MKRIIAAIAVVAVVSSALAFNTKKFGAYCVANTSGGSCNVLSSVTEINTGKTQFSKFVYTAWDGTTPNCINSTSCTTPITLYAE